jgi:hypothetical protein
VFARPLVAQPPKLRDEAYYAKFREVIDNTTADHRAMDAARFITPVVEKCAGVADVFNGVADVEPEQRCMVFTRLGQALVDCGCPKDVEDELLTFHWAMHIGEGPRHGVAVVAVEFDVDAPPTTVSPDQTWADYAKSVKGPALAKLWLAVE